MCNLRLDSIYERQLHMTDASTFWSNAMCDYDFKQSLPLPYDRRRLDYCGSRGTLYAARFEFSSSLNDAFLAYASKHNVSIFQLGLACLFTFVARLASDVTDVDLYIVCLNANRYRPELQRIVGLFVATLPHRLCISLDESFEQILQRIRKLTLGILNYSYFPLQQILKNNQVQSSSSIFQTVFDINIANPNVEVDGARLDVEPFSIDEVAKFDLFVRLFQASKKEESHFCSFNTCLDVFDQSTVDTMIARFHHLLKQLFLSPDNEKINKISHLSLTLPEQCKIIHDLDNVLENFPGCRRPSSKTLHVEFYCAAYEHPQKVAVILDEQMISYGELASIVSKQVNYFQKVLGVEPGDIIYQCIERGVEMVVGMLTILACDAIYFPLNPHDPPQQLIDLVAQTSEVSFVKNFIPRVSLINNFLIIQLLEFNNRQEWHHHFYRNDL